ncbi:hypothetical protein Thermo_00187 [Thermoplasmatales archaeon]|nr:hypothetical protein Thermo_00187 [Thermoplasmatales archaeon]
MTEGRDISSLFTVYIGIAAVIACAVLFFVLVPSMISNFQSILGMQSSNYIIFNLSVSTSFLAILLMLTALALVASLYLFVAKPIVGMKSQNLNEVDFFRYFSVFILLEFFISILTEFIPGYSIPSIYSTPLGVQAFVLGVSSLSELVLLQFIPLFVMIAAYLALTRRLSLSNLLHPHVIMKRDIIVPAIIASVLTSALFSQTVSGAFFNLLTFLMLDYIYLRFGILHSFVAGFTVSMLGVLTAFSASPDLALAALAFLTLWSFVGIFNMGKLVPARTAAANENISDNLYEPVQKKAAPVLQNSEILWIRSSCPNCGTANFYIRDGMRLECMSCHHIIERDAVGPANIVLEQRRPFRI